MKFFYILLFSITFLISCNSNNTDLVPRDGQESLAIQSQGVMCGELVTDIDWYLNQSKAPIIQGLDVIQFPISTESEEAQKYFNQGLVLAYGFNHAEAARSFHEAIRSDPNCAMCYWGFAYVLGPNYNAGMEADNYERAFEAVEKAKGLIDKVSDKEKALIFALTHRYELPAPDDRQHMDIAFSKALEEVFDTYTEDADIACLYAESLMNLHPWDLYDIEGNAKPWTADVLSSLERVLDLDPEHPGAHHLYIHAVEASSTPHQGYVSAKKFDDGLVPGSGHLLHMPSHIYIRTGDYHRGLLANIEAIKVDSSYLTQCHAQGAYPLAYYPHNMHFIAALGLYAGNSAWAVKGANEVSKHAHRKLMKEPGWGTLQHFYAMPYYIAVKFAKWDEILQMEESVHKMKYPNAIGHFARGMAFLGKDDFENATKELKLLSSYAKDESLKETTIWDINNTYTLIQIAKMVLESELQAKNKNFDVAIAILKEAAAIEDGLQYQEPTDWLLHVRHHLGAILVEAGRGDEAIEIYQNDLLRAPRNGWALQGLKNVYLSEGMRDELQVVEKQFVEAWQSADIEISSSRIW